MALATSDDKVATTRSASALLWLTALATWDDSAATTRSASWLLSRTAPLIVAAKSVSVSRASEAFCVIALDTSVESIVTMRSACEEAAVSVRSTSEVLCRTVSVTPDASVAND